MTASEPASLSPFQDDADEPSREAFQSLDILARSLHVKEAGLEPALQAIVSAALAAMNRAQYAGLILVIHGELIPQVITGRPPQLLDQLQQKLKDGPCINAAVQQSVIRVGDMHGESRWPEFVPAAANLGVRSMLCVPLWIHDHVLGTLSLYSESAQAFTSQDEPLTRLFATLAAIALAEAQRTDQFRAALANRDVIGQAKGILMERHRLTADAAFRALSRASQHANIKLSEVAGHLVATGELPGVPRAEQ